MFKLVIGLFLMSAPSSDPAHVMVYNKTAFPTEASCKSFFDTDEGKEAVGAITMMAHGQGLFVKFACMEAKDNSMRKTDGRV